VPSVSIEPLSKSLTIEIRLAYTIFRATPEAFQAALALHDANTANTPQTVALVIPSAYEKVTVSFCFPRYSGLELVEKYGLVEDPLLGLSDGYVVSQPGFEFYDGICRC